MPFVLFSSEKGEIELSLTTGLGPESIDECTSGKESGLIMNCLERLMLVRVLKITDENVPI